MPTSIPDFRESGGGQAGPAWMMTLVGLLLLLEGLGFLLLGFLHLTPLFEINSIPLALTWSLHEISIPAPHSRILGILFILLALGSRSFHPLDFFSCGMWPGLPPPRLWGQSADCPVALLYRKALIRLFRDGLLQYHGGVFLNHPDVQNTFRSRESGFCRGWVK